MGAVWPSAVKQSVLLFVKFDARSHATVRLGALTQSWFPMVSTVRLPSFPSNVLPARLAPAVEPNVTASAYVSTAITIATLPINCPFLTVDIADSPGSGLVGGGTYGTIHANVTGKCGSFFLLVTYGHDASSHGNGQMAGRPTSRSRRGRP